MKKTLKCSSQSASKVSSLKCLSSSTDAENPFFCHKTHKRSSLLNYGPIVKVFAKYFSSKKAINSVPPLQFQLRTRRWSHCFFKAFHRSSLTACVYTYPGLPYQSVGVTVSQSLHDSLNCGSHFLGVGVTSVYYLQVTRRNNQW